MSFKFTDKVANIDFGHIRFDIEITSKTYEKCIDIFKKINVYTEKEEITGNEIQEACIEIWNAIDDLLEDDGAVKKIFEDREINYFDLCDVLKFILNEITNKANEYMSKYRMKNYVNSIK